MNLGVCMRVTVSAGEGKIVMEGQEQGSKYARMENVHCQCTVSALTVQHGDWMVPIQEL